MPPTRKTTTITWPFGGLHRGRSYQQQPPYTCPAASNVRTVDVAEGRRRGGRRPGLMEVYHEAANFLNTTPARFLRQITTLSGRRLCAWANDRFWMEDSNGTMQAYQASLTADLNNDVNLECAEYLGQLFIADRGGIGSVVGQDRKVIVDVDNFQLTVREGQMANFLYELGVAGTQKVTLTAYPGYSIAGTYTINSVVTGAASDTAKRIINLKTSTGATGVAYAYVERPPKIWDPESGDLIAMRTTVVQTPPIGYRLVCRYSNRLFWAGNPDTPYAWVCSRSGDPLDYDFSWGLDDVARATYWQASDQKTIGQPITALIPEGNAFLYFGCSNSIWMLTGDPTYGGMLEQVDNRVGVLSSTAWCSLPGGAKMLLSYDGVYLLVGKTVTALSRERLPRDLVGIDPTLYTISMCYEPRHRGVHIIASKTAATTHELPIAYWYDLEQQAFWPVAFDYTAALDQSPLRAELQLLDNGSSRVLLATKHGEVAYFNDAAVKDLNDTTGTAITGTVTLGPFRLGADDFSEGMLTKLVGILDAQSTNVTWTVHVADTAEGAIAAAAHSTGTWTPGRSMPEYVRARGAAMCIKLSGTGKWAFEAAVAEIERLGLVRAL